MIIGIPKEITPGEERVPIVPDTVKKLCDLGAILQIEKEYMKIMQVCFPHLNLFVK